MAKVFICVSEELKETENGVKYVGFEIRGDCALEPGEDPNKSQILLAMPIIEYAISAALSAVFNAPIHVNPPGQSKEEGAAIAAEKIENPFSQIEEIDTD